MYSKLMSRTEAENCIFEQLGIDSSNADEFERIINLPYEIYVVTINRLCSGEINLDDLNTGLFDAESKVDKSALLPELDTNKIARGNIGVKSSLEKDFIKGINYNQRALPTEGVFTNPIYEAKENFTGSSEGDIIAANAIAKINNTILPGDKDIIIERKDNSEIKEQMANLLNIDSSKLVNILLNGRNKKFVQDTPELKKLKAKKGLLKQSIAELEKIQAADSFVGTKLIQTYNKLKMINKKIKIAKNKQNNIVL